MNRVVELIRRETGFDLASFCDDRVRRAMIGRQIELGLDDVEAYIPILSADALERQHLIDSVAINYSSFFRDPFVFESLVARAIPELRARAEQSRAEIRMWSAGCAAGEEAYSLAIVACETMPELVDAHRIRIFASDIDSTALAQAEEGAFSAAAMDGVTLGRLRRYFVIGEGCFRVAPQLRQMISFSRDDLNSARTVAPPDSIFGDFDLIICKNVLIYLDDPAREFVLGKLIRSLRDGGFLVFGPTECLRQHMLKDLSLVDEHARLYQKARGR